MSKRKSETTDSLKLIVLVAPADGNTGWYQARLDGDDRVLCVSRTPFFDAARTLVAAGYSPDTILILRHVGSDTDSLRARLGTAASLTVEETGYGPQIRRGKPFSTVDDADHRAEQTGGDEMYPIDPLPGSLRSAFDEGHEQIGFGICKKKYLFVAEYDEWPFVKGMLFVADDEPDMWIVIAGSGDEYAGDNPPEPWKGLPDFMAEKIAWAACLYSLNDDE
jgi:hypothetical protein